MTNTGGCPRTDAAALTSGVAFPTSRSSRIIISRLNLRTCRRSFRIRTRTDRDGAPQPVENRRREHALGLGCNALAPYGSIEIQPSTPLLPCNDDVDYLFLAR